MRYIIKTRTVIGVPVLLAMQYKNDLVGSYLNNDAELVGEWRDSG